MQSAAEKTATHPFRFIAAALFVYGVAFTSLYAMANLQTDTTLAFAAVVDEISYDMNSDGTAVHRFGWNGGYSITCQDGTPIAWELPASRSEENIAHVCAKIEAQRTNNL